MLGTSSESLVKLWMNSRVLDPKLYPLGMTLAKDYSLLLTLAIHSEFSQEHGGSFLSLFAVNEFTRYLEEAVSL